VTEKKPWYEEIKDRFRKLEERSQTVEQDVSYMKGTLDEMKRHNSLMVKVLLLIISIMGAIICALIGLG